MHSNTLCHTGTRRSTPQHTATHCNAATHCNTLQHTALYRNYRTRRLWRHSRPVALVHTCSCNNTLQHTATHCNTLQHTATHCNILHNTLQHTATHCNTLQHTATHCNTLQLQDAASLEALATSRLDADMLVEAAAAVSELLEMVLEQPIDKLGRKLARRKVEKSPGLCQKSSTFYQKRPIVNEESSLELPIDKLGRKLARCTVSACSVALVLVYQKSPTLYQKSPTLY